MKHESENICQIRRNNTKKNTVSQHFMRTELLSEKCIAIFRLLKKDVKCVISLSDNDDNNGFRT